MDRVLALRIVFLLGVVNALMLLSLFFSCRCMGSRRPFLGLLHTKVFGRFYKSHCYYWMVLGLSVAVHLGVAIWALGIPF